MTAYEVKAYAKAVGSSDLRLAVTQAWMTANWGRGKRIPHLKSVLAKIDRAERGTEGADDRVMKAARVLEMMGSAGSGSPG